MNSSIFIERSLLLMALMAAITVAGCGDGSSGGGSAGTVTVEGVGEFATIQAAIDASPPGSVIHIGPGTFQEQLDVNKSLTIMGSGSSTIVQMPGTPIAFPDDGSDSSIAACEIRDTSGVMLKDMTCTGPEDGIRIRDSFNITVMNVDASGNGDDGLDIRDSQDVTISASTFNENGDKGILIRDGSSNVVVEDSEMNNNIAHGIRARESTDITVDKSTISGNGDDGIEVRNVSGAEITGNEITNNAVNGVQLRDSTDVTITDNTITGNGEFGIRSRNTALGDLSTNTLSPNGLGDIRQE